MLIEAVLRVPQWPVGHAQRRTFVEIIGVMNHCTIN